MTVKSARREVGKLVVVCLKAQHLASKHSFTKQDPYCVVKLSNSGEEKTAVDKGGGQHPVWDEQFTFTVFQIEGEVEKLEVTVWSKELTEDELIGKGEVIIDLKWTNNEFDDWVPLSKDGKERGDVFLEMTFYPVLQVQAVKGNLTRRPSKFAPDQRLARPNKEALPKPNHGEGSYQGRPHRIASGSQLQASPEVNQLPGRRNSLDGLTGTESPIDNVALKNHAPVGKNVYQRAVPVQTDRLPLPGDPDLPTRPDWMNPGKRIGERHPDNQTTNQEKAWQQGQDQGPSRAPGQKLLPPQRQSSGVAEPGVGGFVPPPGASAGGLQGAWDMTQNNHQGHSGQTYQQPQFQPQCQPQAQQHYQQQHYQQQQYQQQSAFHNQQQQPQQQAFFSNQQQQASPHPQFQQHPSGSEQYPAAPTPAQHYPQSTVVGSQTTQYAPQPQLQHIPPTTAPYGGSPYGTGTSYPAYSGLPPGTSAGLPYSTSSISATINSFNAPSRLLSFTPSPKPTPLPLTPAPPKRNPPPPIPQTKYYSAAPPTQTANPTANHAPPPIPALPKSKPAVEAAPVVPPPVPQRPSTSSRMTVETPATHRESSANVTEDPPPPSYAPPVAIRNPEPPSPTVSTVSTALPAFEDVTGLRARSPTPPPPTPPPIKTIHAKSPMQAAPARSSPSPTRLSSRSPSIHPGQAELHERIQQERRDAAMAAQMAAEAEREEERARKERERMDEEFAKLMTEQDGGEEEARRLREEEDERLARALAERPE